MSESEDTGVPGPSAAVEEILQQALGEGEEGDYEAMGERLREALKEHPDNPFLLCWLGVAERELGHTGIAYERFKECLAQQPEDPHVLATAGNAVAAFDDPDAEAALRTAAMRAPDLPLARWMYGAYLAREGFPDQALEELDAAVELAPEDPLPVLERGVAHALNEEMEAAAEDFSRTLELDPQDGWTRILLGLVLAELDRTEEAAGDLVAGARERPGDVEAQLLAALGASAAAREDLAWEMLERARQRALPGDLPRVSAVEERLAVPEAAWRFLTETLGPGALRERLMERP